MTKQRMTRVTNLRLPNELYERVQKEAEERDISMSKLMVKAVQHYLDEHLAPVELP